MYEQTLTKSGLTIDQASIYEVLLKNGPLPAGEVSKKATLKRGLTYKVLDELVALSLVSKNKKAKVLRFEAAHPLRLKELAEQKEQSARVAQEALGGIIGNLTSDFNLISGKPGVQYFEGRGAIKKITDDSLTAQGEIYAYIDNEALDKFMLQENEKYVPERVKRNIFKKIISPDTPYDRKLAPIVASTLGELRVIPGVKAFSTVTQMYNNKVSFLTLNDKVMIGILIEDPYVSLMHKTLFEHLWRTTPPFQVDA